jgi:hypothetical protein
VIMAGTPLSRELNPGGERVYRTLPDSILMDIRDAVLDETTRLPAELRAILGLITTRATEASRSTTWEGDRVRTDTPSPNDSDRNPNPSASTTTTTTTTTTTSTR